MILSMDLGYQVVSDVLQLHSIDPAMLIVIEDVLNSWFWLFIILRSTYTEGERKNKGEWDKMNEY